MSNTLRRFLKRSNSQSRDNRGYLKVLLPVLGGMVIGLLATLLMKLAGGKLNF